MPSHQERVRRNNGDYVPPFGECPRFAECPICGEQYMEASRTDVPRFKECCRRAAVDGKLKW